MIHKDYLDTIIDSYFKLIMNSALFFLGRWRGIGSVIEKPVKYLEEATFEIFRTTPATVIAYNHKTWADEEKTKPMHYESGVIKIFP